jgi:RNA polymerase sigma factor (sigma-70 family)
LEQFEELATKIYNDNFSILLNYFKKRGLCQDSACELTHLTLTKGILNIDRLKQKDEVSIKKWLFYIGKNLFLNDVKRRKKTVLSDNITDYSGTEDNIYSNDILVDNLNENDLQLSTMYLIDGYTLDEISTTYGVNKKSIKNKIYRIRKKLKNCI